MTGLVALDERVVPPAIRFALLTLLCFDEVSLKLEIIGIISSSPDLVVSIRIEASLLTSSTVSSHPCIFSGVLLSATGAFFMISSWVLIGSASIARGSAVGSAGCTLGTVSLVEVATSPEALET